VRVGVGVGLGVKHCEGSGRGGEQKHRQSSGGLGFIWGGGGKSIVGVGGECRGGGGGGKALSG
jgi:hypothetical protein